MTEQRYGRDEHAAWERGDERSTSRSQDSRGSAGYVRSAGKRSAYSGNAADEAQDSDVRSFGRRSRGWEDARQDSAPSLGGGARGDGAYRRNSPHAQTHGGVARDGEGGDNASLGSHGAAGRTRQGLQRRDARYAISHRGLERGPEAASAAGLEGALPSGETGRASATARRPRLAEPSPLVPDAAYDMDPGRRRQLFVGWNVAIMSFKVILALGCVLGLLWFLRPSVSEVEKRQLTSFPELTIESLFSGDFTAGVSTWYADTFPFRDQLVGADLALKRLYGFEASEQMVGTGLVADEIPVVETGDAEGAGDAEPAEEQVAPRPEPVVPQQYTAAELEEMVRGQILAGMYVKDGAAFEGYYFSKEAADTYVAALDNAAARLGEGHQVYSILVPNNSGVLLSDAENAAMDSSDQRQAIAYYYNSYGDGVTSVPTIDTLIQHSDEYLYFRTDHHWTALAAYYVYRNLCDIKGWTPHELDEFEMMSFPGFLGSAYNELRLGSMEAYPDIVYAWVPLGTNDMVYYDDGVPTEWYVVFDVTGWASGSQYITFIGGDHGWSEIHNEKITDGSSCVVVKESYGNCFVPWLVDHYEHVYVADWRYVGFDVVDFMLENDVDDLIMCNNIMIIGNTDVAQSIAGVL